MNLYWRFIEQLTSEDEGYINTAAQVSRLQFALFTIYIMYHLVHLHSTLQEQTLEETTGNTAGTQQEHSTDNRKASRSETRK